MAEHLRRLSARRLSHLRDMDTREMGACHRLLLCCKYGMMNSLERYFLWHGRIVARYPLVVILTSFLFTIICGLGLINFYEESDMTALWVPKGSPFRNNVEWLHKHFPQNLRFNQAIFRAENVLTPPVVKEMYAWRKKMINVTHNNLTWEDVCFRVPVVAKPKCFKHFEAKFELYKAAQKLKAALGSILTGGKRKRSVEASDDWDDFDDDWDSFDRKDRKVNECEKMEENAGNLLNGTNMTALMDLFGRMKKEGFSLDLADEMNSKFYPEPYCTIVKQSPTVCYEESILELWGNNGKFDEESDKAIENITEKDILEAVNGNNKSGIFMIDKDFRKYLGEVVTDEDGNIVGAGAATITLIGKVNSTDVKLFGSVQRGEVIDKRTFDFEGEMVKVATDRNDLTKGVQTFVNVHRMLFESLEGQAFKDAGMLILGYFIVFIFVLLMLGKFNMIEQKIYLSIGGILGVIMGIIVSYGICSAMGFFYSAAHTVMPFLLLGIGIDDMFVIVQCWNSLGVKAHSKPVTDKIGATMSHAGVAITITSVTDFIAFSIGGSTSLPALQSFCMYAAVGILTIYIFQATYFVALLSLDERRVEARRDGCCCCYRHGEEDQSNRFSQKSVMNNVFKWAGVKLTSGPVKYAVLLLTAGLLGAGMWGVAELKQEFKPEWLMDPQSEVSKWFEAHKSYFPKNGEGGNVYLKFVDYPENFQKIDDLVVSLQNQDDIIKSVNSWHTVFKEFIEADSSNVTSDSMNTTFFQQKLSQFLFSAKGARFKNEFKFAGDLKCGEPAPPVIVSQIGYQHLQFPAASDWVPAMDRVKTIVGGSNIVNHDDSQPEASVFPMAIRYANWETDKVIGMELYQNLLMSLIAIYVTILIFLGSFLGATIVIFCVAATIVNVAGFMHFWGLTIDVISCNTLVISIGLCIDFSAHIAHGFLSTPGDRRSRVISTMTNIGPAVLNGGVSTLLAFILLSTSQSYVFLSFFKIFFLICVFGLYHGLVALPVILSIMGPLPQISSVQPEELEPVNKMDLYAVKNGHTDDQYVVRNGHTDDQYVVRNGHTDDQYVVRNGHTDDQFDHDTPIQKNGHAKGHEVSNGKSLTNGHATKHSEVDKEEEADTDQEIKTSH